MLSPAYTPLVMPGSCPGQGCPVQCRTYAGGQSLAGTPHEARRVEPDSMDWDLHGHSDTGPGIIRGGLPFVNTEKGLHTPEHAWPLPLLGGN